MGSESDSREELFDSSLDTVNVSVNTELPKNSSHGSEEEEFDFLHLYEEVSDYDFHRMMSVDDFTYSTAFSNEVFDNGEWYTYAGLETCNIMKSARHGKELLSKSIHKVYNIIQMMNLWDQKVIPGRNYLILLLILSMSLSTLNFQRTLLARCFFLKLCRTLFAWFSYFVRGVRFCLGNGCERCARRDLC